MLLCPPFFFFVSLRRFLAGLRIRMQAMFFWIFTPPCAGNQSIPALSSPCCPPPPLSHSFSRMFLDAAAVRGPLTLLQPLPFPVWSVLGYKFWLSYSPSNSGKGATTLFATCGFAFYVKMSKIPPVFPFPPPFSGDCTYPVTKYKLVLGGVILFPAASLFLAESGVRIPPDSTGYGGSTCSILSRLFF